MNEKILSLYRRCNPPPLTTDHCHPPLLPHPQHPHRARARLGPDYPVAWQERRLVATVRRRMGATPARQARQVGLERLDGRARREYPREG